MLCQSGMVAGQTPAIRFLSRAVVCVDPELPAVAASDLAAASVVPLAAVVPASLAATGAV